MTSVAGRGDPLERRSSDKLNRTVTIGPIGRGPGLDPAGPNSNWGYGGQRFWSGTAALLGVTAFAKGIREPNAWAYTQARLNYSSGFMRRGLFGSVLGRPLELDRYMHFAVLSTMLLLLLFAALTLLAHKAKLAERSPPGELLAVYASSYSVSYLANLNGYFDIPMALLCIAPLFVRSTGGRLAAAAVATILGILVHEQFFFAFLPVLVVSVLFGAATGKTPSQRRQAWIGAIVLASMGLVLTAYLGHYGSISAGQAAKLQQTLEQSGDHRIEPEVLKVLPRTPQENLEIMKSVWRRRTYLSAQVESLLMFGPTAAMLSYATFLLLRQWMPGQHSWLYAGALLATLAPLSLHLFGWDKSRWNELLCLNAFLVLLTVTRLMGGEPVRLPMWLRRACLLVMLLNMATGGGMLDNRHIRPFPFLRGGDAVDAATATQHSAAP